MNKQLSVILISVLFAGSAAQAADRVRVVPRSNGGDRREESRPGPSRGSDRSSGGRTDVRVSVDSHRGGGWRRNHAPGDLPVARNRSFERRVGSHNRVEVVPNRYYWHNYDGHRYAHYYRGGRHWYGFYHGPRFYWTQYHANRWWWYDPVFSHWAFWSGGYWWWNAPGGVSYVYVNDSYQPYESAGIDVERPDEAGAPPEGMPPGPADESSVTSPDGTRMVQIAGDEDEAFLYDTTQKQPVFMKVLGKGAANAKISGGADGTPMQILINFQDGHFTVFNVSGEQAKLQ